MSEEYQPRPTQAKPAGQLADLTTARTMKLLFSGGSDAWKKEGSDYVLTLRTPDGSSFTSKDIHACCMLFHEQFGIRFDDDHMSFQRHLMDFVINSEELQLLKDKGLAKKDIGTLMQQDMAHHESAAHTNDAMQVLRESLRLKTMDYDGWVPPQKHKFLATHCRESEIFLPHSFVEQLMQVAPQHTRDDTQNTRLKHAVLDALAVALPGIAMSVLLSENERGTSVRLTANEENFMKIETAITALKQAPQNNITDFRLAAQRLKNPTTQRE